ncbi:beta-galactosidase [Fulvivirgaceae bacterium PWU4]|uniref:Beta-galactosidase n=1 Tax=Chryseosolibacter histidini TaxID=2782349 RepID=A0AAP2DJ28_9BACT|nr:sugar-binding domain-containing protein [Chryseosolibacter histidini]MBT1697220.1 beta-galactosidase [Chryseosolibacter histidini]
MKRLTLLGALCCLVCFTDAQPQGWKVVEGKITTPWAAQVNAANPLPEYPRPQLVRSVWMNLNGLWDFAIRPEAENIPSAFEAKILVPFAVESALSGAGKTVGKDNRLWYKRSFTLSSDFKNKNVLLHFGAVDWKCDVFVNGKAAGSHQGGYDPFSFDITALLKKSGAQEIVVSVWDPSDDGPQPRGKQIKNPRSIWYTPVTGIWQTVWAEAVPKTYIESTRHTPDIDKQTLTVKAVVKEFQPGDKLHVSAWDGTRKIAEQEVSGDEAVLQIKDAKLWSPANPFLYDLTVAVVRKGKRIDEVKSYFGMRKISMVTDQQGVQRMLLNNKFVFQYGPLDQGWWPDGLYTAPTDEALKFDIEKTKEMGFNMIRKHVKVEPARWYFHCDKLGMLVWQDMPSGDMGNHWEPRPAIIGLATDKARTAESEKIFRTEWKAIIDSKINFPCIVVWVPFNEGWGQFKTEEITQWTMDYDPSRLVNPASGGNFVTTGHIMDLHNYPAPCMPDPKLFGKQQIIVLGEFGGLGLPLEGHTWQEKNNWGYQSFPNKTELLSKYKSFIDKMPDLIKVGLSAAVYTQTTDVEIEVNGLMTYDRKVVKMPEAELATAHKQLYDPSLVKLK